MTVEAYDGWHRSVAYSTEDDAGASWREAVRPYLGLLRGRRAK